MSDPAEDEDCPMLARIRAAAEANRRTWLALGGLIEKLDEVLGPRGPEDDDEDE